MRRTLLICFAIAFVFIINAKTDVIKTDEMKAVLEADSSLAAIWSDTDSLAEMVTKRINRDTTMFYSGGTTQIIAGATRIIYADTLAANEYLIIHQVNAGGGLSVLTIFDYELTIDVRLNGNIGESAYDFRAQVIDRTSTIAPTLRLVTNHFIYCQPGDTVQVSVKNEDNETDAVWYNYIVQKITN